MRFTLTYRGALPANGDARIKQAVRRQLHPQLKHLFTYPPLSHKVNTMLDEVQTMRPCIIERLGPFRFAPLVSSKYDLVAAVELLFLRPEPPGRLITQGGDIDNRLKTLVDALRMPRVQSEIPNGDLPRADEDPFFCLLQDDALITEIDVKTDVLLEPAAASSEVHLFLRVRTECVNPTFNNMGL
jgi:hypothetical protein